MAKIQFSSRLKDTHVFRSLKHPGAMAVTTTDKDGQEKPILKQEWNIDYEATLQWLKGNKLDKVIESAYDEKEKTPQVKGPKAIVFLGEGK
jgi:hypothetical protein